MHGMALTKATLYGSTPVHSTGLTVSQPPSHIFVAEDIQRRHGGCRLCEPAGWQEVDKNVVSGQQGPCAIQV